MSFEGPRPTAGHALRMHDAATVEVPMRSLNRNVLGGLVALAALAVPGCALFSGMAPKMGGGFDAINTMSIAICKVTVYSPDNPSLVYDNEIKHKILIAPGAKASLGYPVEKGADGVPKKPASLAMKVHACKAGNFDLYEVGDVVADIQGIEVESGPVAIR